jgi:putative transposase of IS4/5 family DUF4096
MLPNKPRGVRRVNDRRVLNGIFWVLRSGAPWRDLPENYGPRTTCYNRFVRWHRAGVCVPYPDSCTAANDVHGFAIIYSITSSARVSSWNIEAERLVELHVDGRFDFCGLLGSLAPLRMRLHPSVLLGWLLPDGLARPRRVTHHSALAVGFRGMPAVRGYRGARRGRGL